MSTLSQYRTSTTESLSYRSLDNRFQQLVGGKTVNAAMVQEWCNIGPGLAITHAALKKTPLKNNGVDMIGNIWINSSDAVTDGIVVDGIQLPSRDDDHIRLPFEPASHKCTNTMCRQPVNYNHVFCPYCGQRNEIRTPPLNQKQKQVWVHPKINILGDRNEWEGKLLQLFGWALTDVSIYQRFMQSGLVRFQVQPLSLLVFSE